MIADVISEQELREVDLVARVEIAQKVGRLLSRLEDGHSDRDILLQLARFLVEDISVSVREALAKELRSCQFLPDDLIAYVAQDIDQVAMPFVIASKAISDAFLEKIARQCTEGVQEAIAARGNLAETIAYIISDVGTESAVEILMRNDSAEVSERVVNRAVDRFPESQSLMEAIAGRAGLPVAVIERIILMVSREYAEHLVGKFELSTDYTTYLTSLAQRSVFSKTLDKAAKPELLGYLRELDDVGQLTSDTLMTFLRQGHIRLFAAAIAVMLDRDIEDILPPIKSGHVELLTGWLARAGLERPIIKALREAYMDYLKTR